MWASIRCDLEGFGRASTPHKPCSRRLSDIRKSLGWLHLDLSSYSPSFNSAFRATLVHARHHLFGTLAANTDERASGSAPARVSPGVPVRQPADTASCVNLRIDPALGKVPSGLYESPDDQGPTIRSNDLDPNLPLGCRSCRILENDSQPVKFPYENTSPRLFRRKRVNLDYKVSVRIVKCPEHLGSAQALPA